ncbi:hypothetical protein SELMODRAFT_411336 [Selaginella moellendorffii]|uniref:Uncharacterized protein n=1 Tax=Selaginella moellendorffii TaxID=88036 RepID=D8RHB6_SELML|nr:hypothetical protein SELMODRAFT_411336 [Selaginella moellendorffii]
MVEAEDRLLVLRVSKKTSLKPYHGYAGRSSQESLFSLAARSNEQKSGKVGSEAFHSSLHITMLEEKFSSAGKMRDFMRVLTVFQRRILILDGADEKVQLDSAIEAAMAVVNRGGSI